MIAGPSGVGKGSIVRELLVADPEELWLSVSATTRPRRPTEQDGVDYRFVSEEAFDELVATDTLLEWAHVVGHRYGTPAEPVERARDEGRDVILEIDVQGARQVRDHVPDAVLIFVRPPSLEELERRLRSRGTEDDERIARRIRTAEEEMRIARTMDEARGALPDAVWFDFAVVNEDLERASAEVAAIIQASRRARS